MNGIHNEPSHPAVFPAHARRAHRFQWRHTLRPPAVRYGPHGHVVLAPVYTRAGSDMASGEEAGLLLRRVRRADTRGRPRAFLVLLLSVFVLAACLVTVALSDTRAHAAIENDGAPWRPYRHRVAYLPQAAGAVAALLAPLCAALEASAPLVATTVGVGAHVAAHLAACRHATWLALFLTLALAVQAHAMPSSSKADRVARVLHVVARAAVWVPLAWDARADVDYLVGILLGAAFLASAAGLADVACLLLSLVAPWRGVGI